MLITRDYNKNIINAAIEKVSHIERKEANPMLPCITKVVGKYWKFMTQNKHIKEIFPMPPMVAYKQPPNLKSMICRAKLPTVRLGNEPRKQIGMKRCLNSCNVCIYYNYSKDIKSKSGDSFPMTGQFGCHTTGVVYLATCSKCKIQYVGETGRRFYDRMIYRII